MTTKERCGNVSSGRACVRDIDHSGDCFLDVVVPAPAPPVARNGAMECAIHQRPGTGWIANVCTCAPPVAQEPPCSRPNEINDGDPCGLPREHRCHRWPPPFSEDQEESYSLHRYEPPAPEPAAPPVAQEGTDLRCAGVKSPCGEPLTERTVEWIGESPMCQGCAAEWSARATVAQEGDYFCQDDCGHVAACLRLEREITRLQARVAEAERERDGWQSEFDSAVEKVVRVCLASRQHKDGAGRDGAFMRDELLSAFDPLMVVTQRLRAQEER